MTDGDAPDLTDSAYYCNRELSELAFQRRVLQEALDERTPLLERVKFLAILTRNLDEFVRKRVGRLRQRVEAGVETETVDGLTPPEEWRAALDAVETLQERQATAYTAIRAALADAGIDILDYEALSAAEREQLRSYFRESVMPTLTPLTFDPTHPFPHISNLSLSLAVLTRESPTAPPVFSRVKVPGNRPRLVQVGEDDRFVLLEAVIGANLDLLFPNVEVVGYSTFRVTRNAAVRRNDVVPEDLSERIEAVLRERRFARVVRLELAPDAPEAVRDLLVDQLDLQPEEVFDLPGPLDYRAFSSLVDLDRPALKRDPWEPRDHPRLPADEDVDVFERIRERDLLVHHPYHSFESTVQRFLETAASDPDVLAIKAAIYRTAEDSAVVESLIEAARNGKQVGVMVELKARFDEANNLRWVERLEEEGIHVAYGKLGYKTHTKTSLVVREESDGVRLYSHVGTGNYHSETAKQYEDLGLLTADRAVGQDLVKLFNYFTGHSLHEDYEKLLIAPTNMREHFADLIDATIDHASDGGDARIVAKMNRLEDPALVRALYRASRAGVTVDLIVRDVCRLRPGVAGVSENVTVRSVVGRFLEHSRVWRFEHGDGPEYFLGSADWMTRNLDDRVEAAVPVEDPRRRAYLDDLLATLLADNRRAWEKRPDGTYEQCTPGDRVVDTHAEFMQRAAANDPDVTRPAVAVDFEGPLAPDPRETDQQRIGGPMGGRQQTPAATGTSPAATIHRSQGGERTDPERSEPERTDQSQTDTGDETGTTAETVSDRAGGEGDGTGEASAEGTSADGTAISAPDGRNADEGGDGDETGDGRSADKGDDGDETGDGRSADKGDDGDETGDGGSADEDGDGDGGTADDERARATGGSVGEDEPRAENEPADG